MHVELVRTYIVQIAMYDWGMLQMEILEAGGGAMYLNRTTMEHSNRTDASVGTHDRSELAWVLKSSPCEV